MNFWSLLRWISALLFVALVLLAWLGAERPDSGALEDNGRAAPRIVR